MTHRQEEIKSADTPPPGSDAAIDAGCTCPVADNNHGLIYAADSTCLDDKQKKTEPAFWIAADCPLHWTKASITVKEPQP